MATTFGRWMSTLTLGATLCALAGPAGAQEKEPVAETAPVTSPEEGEAHEAEPTSDNMFVEDDFTNEFIGAQIIIGSVFSALGIGILASAAVATNKRDDVLAPFGGIGQCDVGAVDPALCRDYRKKDDDVNRATVSGSVVLMTGVTSLVAALVAWATSNNVTDYERSKRASVAPVVVPNGGGIVVSTSF